MSVEIINAKSAPSDGGLPPYYNRTEESRTYIRSAETLAKQQLFCEGYTQKGTLTGAAKYAGIAVSNHFRWLDVDPDYPKRFEVAKLTAQELLVEEGRRRALEGVEEPTGWYKGEPGGFVKRYSDSLLIFLIKGAFPDVYKDRHEHTGKNGGPIEVQSTVTIEQFPIWLKQAIVVISSGIQIDPEVERVLMSHFEAKFLEAERVVGNGVTEGQKRAELAESTHSDTILAESIVEVVAESGSESEVEQEDRSETRGDSEPIQSRPDETRRDESRDYRPAKRQRTILDMDDI